MAGTIIADFIRADANKFSINVGNTIIASVNALGILSNTGNVMISSAGAITANNISTGRIVTPSVMPTGSVLQVVQTNSNVQTESTSSTSTFATISSLNTTITPTSVNSKFLLLAHVAFSNDYSSSPNFGGAYMHFLRNSTGIGLGTGATGSMASTYSGADGIDNDFLAQWNAVYLDSPGTTSPITYSIAYRNMYSSGNIVYINKTASADTSYYAAKGTSSLIIMEIAG